MTSLAASSSAPSSSLAAGAEGLLPGFGNEFSSEALPGALPVGQNNPQRCPYGLYAEQLSGTAFTAPRHKNRRSWLYRLRPSVLHSPFVALEDQGGIVSEWASQPVDPNQLRWAPLPLPGPGAASQDFVQGLVTMAGCGDPLTKSGLAIHMYTANASMGPARRSFMNSDGDLLLVPETGALHVRTEFGVLEVAPKEILLVPRGVRFAVDLTAATTTASPASENGAAGAASADAGAAARGYVLELYEGHFELPGLGPIGANGLANPRDFLHPTAAFEDVDVADGEQPFTLLNKFGGKLFQATAGHSPFDVVAWHGNYVPFKYDLMRFCCMNSVTFDHPDPSIYTVLTAPSASPGVAVADFVIFPPRWMVMEHSFRPPWYHRNCMTEFMGMVYGKYDAKEGFAPGGASLHSCMTPHGPDAPTFEKASTEELRPFKFDGGLAFMFESTYLLRLTRFALDAPHRDRDYQECWASLRKQFNGAP